MVAVPDQFVSGTKLSESRKLLMSVRLPWAASDMSVTTSEPEAVLTLPLPKVTVTTASMVVETEVIVTLSPVPRLSAAPSSDMVKSDPGTVTVGASSKL